jgi:L-2-hydroxyglutarate oxidase LhgO
MSFCVVGKRNGSNVRLIDEAEVFDIDPNVKTFKRALYSPDTASIDPKEVCAALKRTCLNWVSNFLIIQNI